MHFTVWRPELMYRALILPFATAAAPTRRESEHDARSFSSVSLWNLESAFLTPS
jgi:hypothetical protein